MGTSSNYLTRLAMPDQRNHPRRPCNCPGKVFYLRTGVRGYTGQPCRMLNMSEAGCLIETPAASQIPDHIYLVLEGFKMKFPCAVVARSETGMHLQFSIELPAKLVDKITQRRFASDTRGKAAQDADGASRP